MPRSGAVAGLTTAGERRKFFTMTYVSNLIPIFPSDASKGMIGIKAISGNRIIFTVTGICPIEDPKEMREAVREAFGGYCDPVEIPELDAARQSYEFSKVARMPVNRDKELEDVARWFRAAIVTMDELAVSSRP